MTDQSTVGWFRTQPPDPPAHAIRRMRLLRILHSRFDRPLTIIVGAPGHGKTTLLAQAIAEHAYEPQGTDVWICCNARDRAAEHFIAGLAAALGGTPAISDVEGIVDLLVLRSPDAIALVIDDTHVLDDSPGAEVLTELADRLPRHAHLVLASRTMPPVGVRLHQSRGSAVVIDQDALRFTDDERREIAASTGHPDPDALPAWPALATLTAIAGHDASVEYVWDEVLAELDADHRAELAKLALFDLIDDDLAAAVLGGRRRAVDVIGALPLVDRIGSRFRLHDLWRSALGDLLDDQTRSASLLAGARHYETAGDLALAARCYAEGGGGDHVVRLARTFASLPVAGGLDRNIASALRSLLPDTERNGPLGHCLEVIPGWHDGDPDATLLATEAEAAAAGDGELQSLVWWRIIQRSIDMNATGWVIDDRLTELAKQGWPLARSALALVRSHAAQERGDIDGAVAAIDDIDAFDPATRFAARASRLVALGRPEAVAVELADVIEEHASQAVSAHAVWLRGDIAPADAWPIAATLPARYARRGIADVEVPLLSIVSSVAIAAGEFGEARRLADEAARVAASTSRHNQLFAAVADALCVLLEQGDDPARRRLEDALTGHPLQPWPAWPLLGVLATIRALVPGTATLDAMPFGPSLQLAVHAGRIISDLRHGSPPAVADAIDWDAQTLLTVHVPPPLLSELALAAARSNPSAAAVLETIPGADRWLRRLRDHPNTEIAGLAADRIAGRPQRPDHDLTVRALGPIIIERSDGLPVHPLSPGGRVSQLLAMLLDERRVARSDVMARLWPQHTGAAAANNLRVNLHKLLDVLQPDRGPEGSYWLRVDGEHLELVADGIGTDVAEFDRHLELAREAEANGAPSAADQHYASMRDLYRGDYLTGFDDPSIEPERIRLRSVAYAAGCRRAELALARGEPELAVRLAVDAESIDGFSERAPRAQVLAHLALGARSAALEIADRLEARLAADGLLPEPESRVVLERVRRGRGCTGRAATDACDPA